MNPIQITLILLSWRLVRRFSKNIRIDTKCYVPDSIPSWSEWSGSPWVAEREMRLRQSTSTELSPEVQLHLALPPGWEPQTDRTREVVRQYGRWISETRWKPPCTTDMASDKISNWIKNVKRNAYLIIKWGIIIAVIEWLSNKATPSGNFVLIAILACIGFVVLKDIAKVLDNFKPYSYMANVVIVPHWQEILQKIFESESPETINQILEELQKYPDTEEAFNGCGNPWKRKNFFCKIWYNSISGHQIVWSDFRRCLDNNLDEIWIDFPKSSLAYSKIPSGKSHAILIIRPDKISFDEVISTIPYDKILGLIIEAAKEPDSCLHIMQDWEHEKMGWWAKENNDKYKEFRKKDRELQKELESLKIKYQSDYSDSFITPYYELAVGIQSFNVFKFPAILK